MLVAYVENKTTPIIVEEHSGHKDENEHKTVTITSTFKSGSPNVFVEGKPVLRKDDIGEEVCSCCGMNTCKVIQGNESVLVNGKPIARKNDLVKHHIEPNSNLILGASTVNA